MPFQWYLRVEAQGGVCLGNTSMIPETFPCGSTKMDSIEMEAQLPPIDGSKHTFKHFSIFIGSRLLQKKMNAETVQ